MLGQPVMQEVYVYRMPESLFALSERSYLDWKSVDGLLEVGLDSI